MNNLFLYGGVSRFSEARAETVRHQSLVCTERSSFDWLIVQISALFAVTFYVTECRLLLKVLVPLWLMCLTLSLLELCETAALFLGKHRERRHKKEKKESKDKQEKERTYGKHREKKDRKEKQRDKTKVKEKDHDRDKLKGKSSLTDEKSTARPPDTHLNKSSDKSKDWKYDKSAIPFEKRGVGVPAYGNGESFAKTNHVAPQTKTFNYVRDLGRRSNDEERRNSNQLFDKNVAAETKKDGMDKIGWMGATPVADGTEKAKGKCAFDGRMESLCAGEQAKFSGNALGQNSVEVVKLAGKYAGPLVDGRERKGTAAIDGKMDGTAIGRDSRSSGSVLPPNSVGMVQNRVGAMARPVEEKLEQKVVGKERIKEKEGDDRKGEKRKERDRDKSVKKEKDREKEKKKEEKVSGLVHVQMARTIDGSESHLLTPTAKDYDEKDFPGPQSSGILNLPRMSNQGGDTTDSSLGKRKNVGVNGIYDEHISGPNKLARTDCTHQLVENGKSLEASQNAAECAPVVQWPPMNMKVERTFAPDDTQRPPMIIKVDGKEHKINGINSGPLSQPSQATAKVERKSDVSVKPPHPDAKYLSQILSVPKMDEMPEFDDQDWLFSHKGSQTWPERESSRAEETPEVWAKALWLPPVDMFALPYVIPH